MDWIGLALSCGARCAAVIPVSRIVLDAAFSAICKSNACGRYGRCWMCPPHVGDVHALMDRVRSYSSALLYQTVHPLEDSFDFEGMQAGGQEHSRVSLRISRAATGQSTWHLGAGCHLCSRCACADGQPCRHPSEALTPLEAAGVDVCLTAQAAGMPYVNGPDTVTYFGMVLF